MTENDRTACERAIYTRLATGTEAWGLRVYPDFAPAGVARPYIVFVWSGGGETADRLSENSLLSYNIRCISTTKSQAREMAARVRVLLNDTERSATPLSGGVYWEILTSTRFEAVEIVEFVDGTPVYHSGDRYEFRLEAI